LNAPAPSHADDVLRHVRDGADLVVPIANGEPVTVLDALEANVDQLHGVTVRQMHALHDRRYLRGAWPDRLHHVSYFLSPITRECFAQGTVDLVPNHFSEVPELIKLRSKDPLIIASAAPPDRHGYLSLGTSADYVASFIGRARFFVEVNRQMPRTFGRNQLHLSQVVGWCEANYPLVEVDPAVPDDIDTTIGRYVAERIPDGATIQTGIGAIPNAILSQLRDHRNIGVHTELISDGLVDLVDGGVVNGVNKVLNRTKVVGTFALGTKRLYDFVADNPAVELWPVSYVNNPRIIAQERNFVSINATLSVDFLGQCASETIGHRYWSSSGGQADFARGAMFSEGGQGFIVVRSTARAGEVSSICAQLPTGSAVTTMKNTVDKVVTEYGVAELRGRSIRERTRALIDIAHPAFRDELTAQGTALGYL
jgi:acyl-CoA hydrolase